MNQQLSNEEVAFLERSFPVDTTVLMTRKEKLLRFAQVVRETRNDFLVIFHKLEYMDDDQLSRVDHPFSAFAAAFRDPALVDAGLKGDSALDAKLFFELTTGQLHEFSCDCGGHISNEQMAQRIENLASS